MANIKPSDDLPPPYAEDLTLPPYTPRPRSAHLASVRIDSTHTYPVLPSRPSYGHRLVAEYPMLFGRVHSGIRPSAADSSPMGPYAVFSEPAAYVPGQRRTGEARRYLPLNVPSQVTMEPRRKYRAFYDLCWLVVGLVILGVVIGGVLKAVWS